MILAHTFFAVIDTTEKKVSYQKALLTALYSTCQKYLQELSYDIKDGKKTSFYIINTFSVRFDIRTNFIVTTMPQYSNLRYVGCENNWML